ncbi:unnamed protein product [Amoebophrya sp. A120]|nr:unnamed protein product [Amoebophrya sp. A120]|eukprot:GSA120T00007013001.1
MSVVGALITDAETAGGDALTMPPGNVNSDDLEKLNISDAKKKYVRDTLNPLLEDMVMDALFCAKLDQDPTNYLLAWCNLRKNTVSTQYDLLLDENKQLNEKINQCGRALGSLEKAAVEKRIQMEEEALAKQEQEEAAALAKPVEGEGEAAGQDGINPESGEMTGLETDDELLLDDADLVAPNRNAEKRRAVASSPRSRGLSPGPVMEGEEVVPVFAKSDSQRKRLRNTLVRSVLFEKLSEESLQKLIDAMEEVPLEPGDVLYKKSANADYLSILDHGEVHLRDDDLADPNEQLVKIVTPKPLNKNDNNIIDEMAVLHQKNRDFTVVCTKESTIIWNLTRKNYNAVLQTTNKSKRDMILEFLNKVPLFQRIEQTKKSQIVDGIVEREVKANQIIIKQDAVGSEFFILEKGSCVALKKEGEEGEEKQVLEYTKPGDFFGELALLEDQKRQCTIKAVTDCKLLVLNRDAFNRLTGGPGALHELAEKKTAYQLIV